MTSLRKAVVVGAAALLLMALMAGVGVALLGPSHRRPPHVSVSPTTKTGHSLSSTIGFTPVPPLTDAPAKTPVQEQYDAALASGLASSSSIGIAEQARTPAPALSSSWPPLAVANTPERWATEFTARLLDIDFARQSRAGLGAWLSAQAAPELLPGVPEQIQNKALYLTLLDAGAFGNASPIPDQSAWEADARLGLRWSVSALLVEADPTFSQIVASGWEPVDQRFAVEDVSGVLTVTAGRSTGRRDFSMVVYVGSAHWHPGYGSVLVNDWKET